MSTRRNQGRHVDDFRPEGANDQNSVENRRILFPYLILAATQFPLCLVYFKILWTERPHYAMFPVAFLATAFFVFTRWPRHGEPLFFPSTKSDVLLMAGVAFAVLGTLFLSPWLGFASLLLILGSLLARTNDRSVFGTLLPCLAPMCMLLQPPMALDFDTMQGDVEFSALINAGSTEIASNILDLSRYAHNVSGTRMQFDHGIIDSVNVGNGALSLFTLLIVTGIFIAWQRIPMFRGLLLVLAASFWGMTFEAISLVVCAIAETSFEKDYYSPGTANRILLLISMAGAGLMILMTERLIAFACGPVDVQAIDENISFQEKLCKYWNLAVAGQVLPTIDVNIKREVAWAKRRGSKPSNATSSLLWTLGIALGVVCFFQIGGLGLAMTKAGDSVLSPSSSLSMEAGSLPNDIAGWSRDQYAVEEPELETLVDKTDHRWVFVNESGRKCTVEISQPYTGWHDHRREVRRDDWKSLESSEIRTLELEDQRLEYQAGYYNDVLANYRYALSGQVDGFGRGFQAPLTWRNPLAFSKRAFSRIANRSHPRLLVNSSMEIKVYLDTIGPSEPEDREQAEVFFKELMTYVQKSVADRSLGNAANSSDEAN